MDKIYPGVIGLDFTVDCGRDIVGATGTTIEIRKPDGSTVVWDATVYNTNYLLHVTQAGDIDQDGLYRGHACLTYGAWAGRGESFEFHVFAVFE